MIAEPSWSHYAGLALEEDAARDDRTTQLLGPRAAAPAAGRVVAEAACVVAGVKAARAVFEALDPAVTFSAVADGTAVAAGDTVLNVDGPVGVLLAGERSALNYLTHLSAVATRTRRAVEAVAGTGAVITDTRKTTPGLRALEKYAVRVGGGVNHRADLGAAVLWKDNHWALLATIDELRTAVRAVDDIPVCVEVETEAQLQAALEAGVAWLLVDNQPPPVVAEWARRAGPDIVIEASGGITPETARAYAEAGAHRISMGCLTASSTAPPMRFEVQPAEPS